MEENYAEGELGEVFQNATPLPLPLVSRILQQVLSSSHDENDRSAAMIQKCREQVNILAEDCASEEVVEALGSVHLRERAESDQTNAHLSALLQQQGIQEEEDEGFQLNLGGDTGIRRGPLKPFEIIALTTLMPKTAEEAIVLVPSLSRFDPEELYDKVVSILES